MRSSNDVNVPKASGSEPIKGAQVGGALNGLSTKVGDTGPLSKTTNLLASQRLSSAGNSPTVDEKSLVNKAKEPSIYGLGFALLCNKIELAVSKAWGVVKPQTVLKYLESEVKYLEKSNKTTEESLNKWMDKYSALLKKNPDLISSSTVKAWVNAGSKVTESVKVMEEDRYGGLSEKEAKRDVFFGVASVPLEIQLAMINRYGKSEEEKDILVRDFPEMGENYTSQIKAGSSTLETIMDGVKKDYGRELSNTKICYNEEELPITKLANEDAIISLRGRIGTSQSTVEEIRKFTSINYQEFEKKLEGSGGIIENEKNSIKNILTKLKEIPSDEDFGKILNETKNNLSELEKLTSKILKDPSSNLPTDLRDQMSSINQSVKLQLNLIDKLMVNENIDLNKPPSENIKIHLENALQLCGKLNDELLSRPEGNAFKEKYLVVEGDILKDTDLKAPDLEEKKISLQERGKSAVSARKTQENNIKESLGFLEENSSEVSKAPEETWVFHTEVMEEILKKRPKDSDEDFKSNRALLQAIGIESSMPGLHKLDRNFSSTGMTVTRDLNSKSNVDIKDDGDSLVVKNTYMFNVAAEVRSPEAQTLGQEVAPNLQYKVESVFDLKSGLSAMSVSLENPQKKPQTEGNSMMGQIRRGLGLSK